MKKKIRWKGHVKTFLILILMVSLVCLCVIYMLSYQSPGQYSFTRDDMQALSAQSVKYQYADYLKRSYVAPKFIGAAARNFGDNIGLYTLGGENDRIHGSILPFYEKLFGEEGAVTPLPVVQGEALFDLLLQGDHIFVAYEADLPKSLLYAMASEDATAHEGSEEYIREILIVPGEQVYEGINSLPFGTPIQNKNYSFEAIARDSSGHYYRYTTSYTPTVDGGVSFNTNYYLAYTVEDNSFTYEMASLAEFDAYFTKNGLQKKISDTTPILGEQTADPSRYAITASSVYPGAERLDALLSALLINPEKATGFTDTDGTRFFYDEGRNVSLSRDGVLSYTALGGSGLDLADLFEYHTAKESYDMRDYAGASLMLARALENGLGAENAASLILTGVWSDGTTLRFTFGYAYGGLPVYFEGDSTVMRFDFEAGRLTSACFRMKKLTKSAEKTDSIPTRSDMIWLLRHTLSGYGETKEYTLGYLFGKNGGETTMEFLTRPVAARKGVSG